MIIVGIVGDGDITIDTLDRELVCVGVTSIERCCSQYERERPSLLVYSSKTNRRYPHDAFGTY